MMSYVGWVPCLNGKLIFDLAECGLVENKSPVEVVHYDRKNDKLVEYILLHSIVDWKDFGGDELSGEWSVLLFSEREISEDGQSGTISFIPKKDKDRIGRKIIDIAEDINFKTKSGDNNNIVDLFTSLRDEINVVDQREDLCFTVDFRLDSDGIVWLEPRAAKTGDIIARQAYYYIKYAWHKHQHHDSRAETLTTVHKVPEHLISEVLPYNRNRHVSSVLVDDLKKNLVRFKRGIDDSSHRDVSKAKGIVSYTKSLVEILRAKRFMGRDIYTKELNHLGYFQESLDVLSAGIEKEISLLELASDRAKGVILFLLAMLMPVIIVNKGEKDHSELVRVIFSLFSSDRGYVAVIVLMMLIMWLHAKFVSKYRNLGVFKIIISKSVSCIVRDRRPEAFLSNTKVLTSILMIGSVLGALGAFYGVIKLLQGIS